jgi:hypothetical protein
MRKVPMCLRACALIQKSFMLVVMEDFWEFFNSVPTSRVTHIAFGTGKYRFVYLRIRELLALNQ